METLRRTFQNALRRSLKLVGLVAGAAFIVVLSVGANKVVFRVIDNFWLSPLPYEEAHWLTTTQERRAPHQTGGLGSTYIKSLEQRRLTQNQKPATGCQAQPETAVSEELPVQISRRQPDNMPGILNPMHEQGEFDPLVTLRYE